MPLAALHPVRSSGLVAAAGELEDARLDGEAASGACPRRRGDRMMSVLGPVADIRGKSWHVRFSMAEQTKNHACLRLKPKLSRKSCCGEHARAALKPAGKSFRLIGISSVLSQTLRVEIIHFRLSEIYGCLTSSRLHKRGVSRSSRTWEAGCGGREDVSARLRADEGILSDGQAVWSRHPDAGVKLAGWRCRP